MKIIVVVCPIFPSQFTSAVNSLADDKDCEVYAVCHAVNKAAIRNHDRIMAVHSIPFDLNNHERNAIEFCGGMIKIKDFLKEQNKQPNVIMIHTGFGVELLCKTVFPDAPFLGYFEWYYPFESALRFQAITSNAIAMAYAEDCSVLITPSRVQRASFPKNVQRKMLVVHEGINTDYYKPNAEFVTATKPPNQKIITHLSRGLEPVRCFMQFVNIAKLIMLERPDVHIKIIGEDKVFYNFFDENFPNKTSYQTEAMKVFGDDLMKRVTFYGPLPKEKTLEIYQISDLHFHFTKKFGVSWSVLEAMATGCIVLGNEEGMEDVTGPDHCFTTNQYDFEGAKRKAIEILDKSPEELNSVRDKARKFVIDNFNSTVGETKWNAIVSGLI